MSPSTRRATSAGRSCQGALSSTGDRQLVVRDGKIQYARTLWFDDNQVGRRFSDAVVDAVAAFDSTVFAAGEP